MIFILIYPYLTVFILFFLGYGLTLFLLPSRLRSYAFWLSPWFMIVFLIFISSVLSRLGVPMKVITPLTIVFLIGLNVFVLFKRKFKYVFNFKEDLIISLFVIVSILFNIAPLLKQDKFLTTVSMGNNDIIAYTTTADYLVNGSIHNVFTTSEETKKIQPSAVLIDSTYRWGPSLVTAFFLNVFRLEGYQYAYVIQVVIFALTMPLVYLLLRTLYKRSLIGLVLSLSLITFNVNLLYILYHDFTGQIFFGGLEILLVLFFFSYFDLADKTEKGITREDVLIGLGLTVLYFTYHEGVIFVIAPLIFYLILKIISGENIQTYFHRLLKIGFVTFLASAATVFFSILVDTLQASDLDSPIGWERFRASLPYANPFEALGFYSIHAFKPLPILLAIVLSLGVVGFMGYGFVKSRQKKLIFSFISFYLLIFVWTTLIHHNFFVYNRALTYTLFFFVILFTIGFTELLIHRKYLKFGLLTVFILLELFSFAKLNWRFIKNHLSVDKSFISLKELNNNNQIKEPIYLDQLIFKKYISIWADIWTEYFLIPNKLIFSLHNYDYLNYKIPDGVLLLLPKKSLYYQPPKVILKDIIWENEHYKLGRICISDQCLVNSYVELSQINFETSKFEDIILLKGWDIKENSHRWSNAKSSSLRFIAKKNDFLKLTVEMMTLKKPQTVAIYLDGNLIATTEIETKWQIYHFPFDYPLRPGLHNVEFNFSQLYKPSDILDSQDARELSVDFRSIRLE